ncbi:MAG: 50S ribosomal protein L22 [Weeksellaceae bacterium]
MESRTYMKDIKESPKKLRFLLGEVKKRSPQEALDYLMYSPRKPARIYYKVIQSAINNAVNTLKVGADMLQFKLLTVEQGRVLKRYTAGSRGTAKPIKRAYSHIKVVLVEKTKTVAKSEKKLELAKAPEVPVVSSEAAVEKPKAKAVKKTAVEKEPKKVAKKVAIKK